MAEGELIIYPATDPVRLPPKRSTGRTRGDGAMDAGRGHEILTVRPMREGDELRDVYWRKSTTQLIVRERAQELEQDVRLVVDNVPNDETPSSEWLQTFERRIREVASHAVAHVKRGDRVNISASSGEGVLVDAAVGVDRALRFLALLQPSRRDEKGKGEATAGKGATPLRVAKATASVAASTTGIDAAGVPDGLGVASARGGSANGARS
jgi:uncharacterized protein (DUF58 family)